MTANVHDIISNVNASAKHLPMIPFLSVPNSCLVAISFILNLENAMVRTT